MSSTGLNAHGFGLAWFEQKRDKDGRISFERHMIIDDYSTKNAGDVTMSEMHASLAADIDGDGVPDYVTGKRSLSHLDGYTDADPYGAPVLYWFRTVRNPKAPGGAEFVPELIHNRSGVGSQFSAADLNKDGAMDIVTSSVRGTFIFWGQKRAAPAAGSSRNVSDNGDSGSTHRGARLACAVAAYRSASRRPPDKRVDQLRQAVPTTRAISTRSEITRPMSGSSRSAWSYPYGEAGFHPLIVARGVIYARGRNGAIVALDAKTGRELWVRDEMNGMTTRGMKYWESNDGNDQRLIFPMNSLLQEIDAKTGKSITGVRHRRRRRPARGHRRTRSGNDRQHPVANARRGVREPDLLGSAPGEGYMSPPGDLRAYDVITGKLVWKFHTVPHPGEFGYETWPKDAWKYIGGTNTWGELTIDRGRGIVFVPTGSPTYDYYGADRIGANLLRQPRSWRSTREPASASGISRWSHHDLWDFDNNAAPQLTTIRHNGRNRDVVAVAGKTGWLYVFDRVTGEPIWPIEERPVPQTDMPGEQTWPTQPYPTNPPPFAKQSFSVDDINPYLEPAEYERFKQRVLAANNNGLFTPINFTDTVHIPGSNGGALFGGTAAEPTTGAVYVITQDNPGMLRLVTPNPTPGAFTPAGGLIYQQHCQQCHGADRHGTGDGVPLVYANADPAANIAAGAARFNAETIRAILETGRNRMPPFPHLSAADVDILIRYLTAGPGGGGGGRGGPPVASGAPPELIAGSGSVWERPGAPGGRGRGAAPPYPEGGPADRALRDQRVRNDRLPHEAAVHDDREVRPERAGHQVAHRVRRRSVARRTRRHRAPASRRCATASSSPNRVSCLEPGATTRSAPGTARAASSCGRHGLAATSSDRRRCTKSRAGRTCWFLRPARRHHLPVEPDLPRRRCRRCLPARRWDGWRIPCRGNSDRAGQRKVGVTMIDRRTFSQLLAMSLAATAAPVLPAWAQGKKRSVVIGHTGITWPGRVGGGRRGGGAPPPPPDPALNETIFKDVSELGFSGLELFDWQINGLESQGLLGGFVEKYKLPLVSSYTSVNLTDPAQRDRHDRGGRRRRQDHEEVRRQDDRHRPERPCRW